MNEIKTIKEKSRQYGELITNMLSIPEVVDLEEKACIGYVITTSVENNRKKEDIPPFFHEVYDNNKLYHLWDTSCRDMYCIFKMHKNGRDFDYYIATENKLNLQETGYVEINVPQAKYVKVEVLKKNHTAVSEIMMYLNGVWMAANDYKPSFSPAFIHYDERFHANYRQYGRIEGNYPGNPIATLYMPIERS